MKLGIVAPYWETALGFASRMGLECIEIQGRPGSTFDVARREPGGPERIRQTLSDYGLRSSGIIFTVNPLSPGTEGTEAQQYLMEMVELAGKLGIPRISCATGRMRGASFAENLKRYAVVWQPIVRLAATKGVAIVHENCPHDPGNSPNLALNPEWWMALFEALPADNLGLEYDPSHLVWQGADYLSAIRATGSRIFNVHAKDCEVNHRRLARVGYLADGWWDYRIPGAGNVDWFKLFMRLREIGYNGDVLIEHEDVAYGTERMLEAITISAAFLRPLLG